MIRNIIRSTLSDGTLRSTWWQNRGSSVHQFLNSFTMSLIIFTLGVVRSAFSFLAYAPADGADASDYYLYAAYIADVDLPSIVASVKPLYPLFIAFNHFFLGNFSIIHLWHFIFSSLIALLIFIALKRYNVYLALLAAVIILGDMQLSFVFNHVATEPLYVILIVSIYSLVMRSHSDSRRPLRWQDILLVILLVLIFQTRTVARLLWLPIFFVFALQVRDWKRILLVAASFVILFFASQFALEAFNKQMLVNENEKMFIAPIVELDLVGETDGEANQQVATFLDECQAEGANVGIMRCLREQTENTNEMNALLQDAYVETWLNNTSILLQSTLSNYRLYLRLTGLQHIGNPTPADVQCEDVEARIDRNFRFYNEVEWRSIDITESQSQNAREQLTTFSYLMCPPTPTNDSLQRIFDWIAIRYHRIAPNYPITVYGMLLLAVTLIPWLRRYWIPTVTAFGIVTYHGLISAVLSNVQSRYVVIMNPFRAVLLAVMFFLAVYFVINLVDKIMVYRDTQRSDTDS